MGTKRDGQEATSLSISFSSGKRVCISVSAIFPNNAAIYSTFLTHPTSMSYLSAFLTSKIMRFIKYVLSLPSQLIGQSIRVVTYTFKQKNITSAYCSK